MDRKAIKARTVAVALALQVDFGVLVLFVPWGRDALAKASEGVQAVIDSSKEGISFLFGPLIPKEGMAPIMTLIGVPWSEATDAGSYVGQKVVVNEFVAFSNFAPNVADFSQRTQAIVTFALTSFPNLGSLGILLGGLGGMAPKRRGEIAELGLRAILAATLANLMSAAITGILLG